MVPVVSTNSGSAGGFYLRSTRQLTTSVGRFPHNERSAEAALVPRLLHNRY